MVVAAEHELELFGIGATLREARVRRGISLEQVERDTCIRAANLERIEDDLFDELPGDVYALGFVRTYASYLGLDADRFAERFRQARRADREPVFHHALAPERPRRRLLWLAAAVLAAAVAVGAFLWLRGDEPGASPAPKPKTAATAAKPVPGPLAIRAARGRSWVAVRFGGPHGKLVWQGMLRPGRLLRFGLQRPLWVGLGRPGRVDVALAGKLVRLQAGRSSFVFGPRS